MLMLYLLCLEGKYSTNKNKRTQYLNLTVLACQLFATMLKDILKTPEMEFIALNFS